MNAERSSYPVHEEVPDPAQLGEEFAAPSPAGWLEFRPDVWPNARVKAGLITLANDPSAEIDFHAFFAPFKDVRLSTHRVASPQYSNMESLRGVGDHIADAASGVMTDDPLDVVGFACTSASMALGSDVVAAQIQSRQPQAVVTDPMQSALAAFHALGVRTIALLTPYIGEVNVNIAEHLEANDITLSAKGFFRIYDDNQRNRIVPESFVEAARTLTSDRACDALFISCTALRTSPLITALEDVIGKPVITSNQALAWNMLRQCGHNGRAAQFGKLFTSA